MELDSPKSVIEQKFYDLSLEIVKQLGYELYHLEYVSGSSTLRVYIMDPKTGSAVIEDCVAVDRAFDEPVEAATWMPDDLILEVSSPGIYREIKTANHFEKSIGQIVQVVVKSDVEAEQFGGKVPKELKGKKFRATLLGYSEGVIKLSTLEKELEFNINIEQVKKINLDPNL